MVVGGVKGVNHLSSTELLIIASASGWRQAGALPVRMANLRATKVQNAVYACGEFRFFWTLEE